MLTIQNALLDQLFRCRSLSNILHQTVLQVSAKLYPEYYAKLTPSIDFSSSARLPARASPGAPTSSAFRSIQLSPLRLARHIHPDHRSHTRDVFAQIVGRWHTCQLTLQNTLLFQFLRARSLFKELLQLCPVRGTLRLKITTSIHSSYSRPCRLRDHIGSQSMRLLMRSTDEPTGSIVSLGGE